MSIFKNFCWFGLWDQAFLTKNFNVNSHLIINKISATLYIDNNKSRKTEEGL